MLKNRKQAGACGSMEVMDAASFMKLLANEHRIKILAALEETPHLNVAGINAHVGLKGSALTQHLKMLREAGVIECSTSGRFRVYRIAPPYRATCLEIAQVITKVF